MCRPAPASSPIPIRNSSSRNASTRPRPCSAPPKRPSVSPARCGGASSPLLIVPAAILPAGHWFSRYHAAEGEKTSHCRKKGPKRHIDSHVIILHGRPSSINRASGRQAPCSIVAAAKLLVLTRHAAHGLEESNAKCASVAAEPYSGAACGLNLGGANGRGANILADESGAADHAVSARLQRRSHHA